MKHRHVFSASTLAIAESAVTAARNAGIANEDISLIARSDIELKSIPKDRLDAETDTVPAAWRGALEGGATGLIGGLVAIAIPPLGVTAAGVAALAALGAAIGTWSSALMGSAIPNAVRRKFEDEIEAGRILVVIDGDPTLLPTADAAVESTGAKALPFDTPTAIA